MAARILALARRRIATLAALWGGFALLVCAGLFLVAEAPGPRHSPTEPPVQPDLAGFPKWSQVMARTWARSDSHDALCSGRVGRDCNLRSWRRFLESLRSRPLLARITAVNGYINHVRYRADRDNWGVGDYWAAPGEFFASGGDCEDYAIAKYHSLKSLGFDPKAMRILVLKDRVQGLHAVLLLEHGGQTLVLDNLSHRVMTWAELPNYKPLYSVNEASYWLHPGLKLG